ncbi:MAG: patatin-like phospholipase family protein [Acidobacteriota bacterium]
MANQKPNRIIDGFARIAAKIGKGLVALADWIREFHRVARLARFSFWISVLGSAAFFATSQSMEILRIIGEDSEHRTRALIFFSTSALVLSLMSWYWARVLIYRFEPDKLDLPPRDPGAIAARWVPRVCGIIPFVGIGYALLRATHWLHREDEADSWLVFLFWLNLAEGVAVLIGLYLRHKIAKRLRARFSRIWPAKVKSKGTTGITDLPRITWVVILLTVVISTILFFLFMTSAGQVSVSGFLGPGPMILISVASWIAFGSFFVIYFGKLIRLPILTPLLILAFLFSYFDLNDNHAIRPLDDEKIEKQAMKFDDAFNEWLINRKDTDGFKDRPYPVFIVTAEGGGITTGYFTATVLTAIQDRAPNFAQHVFAISGVSGGSIGAAVYAGLAKRCGKNVAAAESGRTTPLGTSAGKLQKSAHEVLSDDYLSPLLSAFLYPDLLQRFLPFAIPSWDRARAAEARFEKSWAEHASCDGKPFSGPNELSHSFYNFFTGFPTDTTPAVFFNTTRVESGERMFVTNLRPPDVRFDTLPALADIDESFNLRFSSAALLSGRFPVITPAGFIKAHGAKLRYVDGGYYENSGAATAFNILMSLKVEDPTIKDERERKEKAVYVYDALLQRDPRIKIIPVIVRIGFPVPEIKSAKPSKESSKESSKERSKYKTQGLNEVSSPIKALLNTRVARGDDSVRQLETAITNLQIAAHADQNGCTAGCVINIVIEEEPGTKLPLGWLLSDKSRCVMQQQVGSVTEKCDPGNSRSASKKIQEIIAMLAPKP